MKLRTLARSCAAAGLLCAAAAEAASQHGAAVVAGGLQREYILVTPDSVPAGPRPLVLLLHGHLGTAANALGAGAVASPLSAWLDIADREHILVAALQGLKGADDHTGWHDCRLDAAEDTGADDVAFARAVIAGLVQSGRADPHRVYVMGMSNGAMMAYRLALELRPAPAAIAAVSGTMAGHSACDAEPVPVSVLLINGTDDPVVPYLGGRAGLRGHKTGTVIGADATRDFWLGVDGLANTPATGGSVPHRSADDPTRAIRLTWGPAHGPQVEAITIQNGGHVEPSLRYHYGWLYRQLVGVQNRDFESAEEAWAFFRDKTAP
ncbi:MAG TPA: PHB depolymerase family esterase [Nevskia sp.]|nr:PHB depolymerase family esterase [Nevskia sp.]